MAIVGHRLGKRLSKPSTQNICATKNTDGSFSIKKKLLNQCRKMWQSCVLTLDEMPSLKTCATKGIQDNVLEEKSKSIVVYPSVTKDNKTVISVYLIETIAIYNVSGQLQNELCFNANEVVLPFEKYKVGTYFLKVNGNKTLKVIKE